MLTVVTAEVVVFAALSVSSKRKELRLPAQMARRDTHVVRAEEEPRERRRVRAGVLTDTQ